MKITDLKRVDELWLETQPYMTAQIMKGYGKQSGTVLELGPFAGGIVIELKKQHPELDITIADETPAIVNFLKQKVAESGFAGEIAVKQTNLNKPDFADSQFDLIIFRGAFFFLREKPDLLNEILRMLKKGGFGFVGGGHGKGVPKQIVSGIAVELRTLHGKLGGKWLDTEELRKIVNETQIKDKCLIVEEGGVWLNINK